MAIFFFGGGEGVLISFWEGTFGCIQNKGNIHSKNVSAGCASHSTCNLVFKGPCSPKRLCVFVLLFWNGSSVECSVLIGCLFPSDNFQLREIPAMHSG